MIRGIVLELYRRYQVTKIYGFRYGYQGLIPRYGYTPIVLRPEALAGIHAFGGSILGTSRGKQNTGDMVDVLEEMNVDLLFVVGGDGTLRGAAEICEEIERRGLKKERHRHPQDHRQRHPVPRQDASGSRRRSREAVKVINVGARREPRVRPTAWGWSS